MTNSKYSDSSFWCPVCSTSVMQFKNEGTTFIYCPVCKEEMLVIREPKVMKEDDTHGTRH
jgi:uncharacterized Zn finger protein (UPF0148 family)